VLVLGCRADPYPALIQTIERTWASRDVPDVSVLFYYGGTELRRSRRHLCVPVPDDLAHVGEKTIAAFEYVLEHSDFDVAFRTNCSSYVDLPNLRSLVRSRGRRTGFYAGLVGGHEGVTFASGSGYFLSRDLVELAVAEREAWDHSLLDDVALGAVLEQHGFEPQPVPRQDYGSPDDVTDVDTTGFHFRCRTDSPARLGDAQVMVKLHRAFCAARGWDDPHRADALRTRGWIHGRTARLLARVKPDR
jgi:hypothetical protein